MTKQDLDYLFTTDPGMTLILGKQTPFDILSSACYTFGEITYIINANDVEIIEPEEAEIRVFGNKTIKIVSTILKKEDDPFTITELRLRVHPPNKGLIYVFRAIDLPPGLKPLLQ